MVVVNPLRSDCSRLPAFPGYSVEITARDARRLHGASPLMTPGSRVSITYLPGESMKDRVAAAATVRNLGFKPVPHLSARRIASRAELDAHLEGLVSEAGVDEVFIVAGDPATPVGPYDDTLAIIRSGALAAFGVRKVGIAGYPGGHPQISAQRLQEALHQKSASLSALGLECSIVTQFGFDAQPVLAWLAQLRAEGIVAPVRVGVAGPASLKTLLGFAGRCGVGASATVLRKYGASITKLLATTAPDEFVRELADGLNTGVHGDVGVHVYSFGGVVSAMQWIRSRSGGHAPLMSAGVPHSQV